MHSSFVHTLQTAKSAHLCHCYCRSSCIPNRQKLSMLRFSKSRQRAVVDCYRRDFGDLYAKSLAVFAEVSAAYQKSANAEAEKQHQKQICDKLHRELDVRERFDCAPYCVFLILEWSLQWAFIGCHCAGWCQKNRRCEKNCCHWVRQHKKLRRLQCARFFWGCSGSFTEMFQCAWALRLDNRTVFRCPGWKVSLVLFFVLWISTSLDR